MEIQQQKIHYDTSLSLSAADIQSGSAFDVAPAPGIGRAIELVSASFDFTAGSIPFMSSRLELIIDTAPEILAVSPTGLLSGVSIFGKFNILSGDTMRTNSKLQVRADAASGAGDGTAKIHVTYRIINI